jgi:hypothetical protein
MEFSMRLGNELHGLTDSKSKRPFPRSGAECARASNERRRWLVAGDLDDGTLARRWLEELAPDAPADSWQLAFDPRVVEVFPSRWNQSRD